MMITALVVTVETLAITPPLPTVTSAIGVPINTYDGDKTLPDQSGGALVSPDGRLTLIVSAGRSPRPRRSP